MSREKENNRELSPAEKERTINFEKLKKELADKGYEERDLTIGVVYANVMALVLAAPIILCFAILFNCCNTNITSAYSTLMSENAILWILAVVAAFAVLIVVHELIHGITWSLFATKRWKSISFGYIAKYMTPYCTCNEALKKWQYIIGSLMPTIILGIIPMVISVGTGSVVMFIIGTCMILSGGGDLTISLKLAMFKTHGKDVICIDHPYQVGLVAFVR